MDNSCLAYVRSPHRQRQPLQDDIESSRYICTRETSSRMDFEIMAYFAAWRNPVETLFRLMKFEAQDRSRSKLGNELSNQMGGRSTPIFPSCCHGHKTNDRFPGRISNPSHSLQCCEYSHYFTTRSVHIGNITLITKTARPSRPSYITVDYRGSMPSSVFGPSTHGGQKS